MMQSIRKMTLAAAAAALLAGCGRSPEREPASAASARPAVAVDVATAEVVRSGAEGVRWVSAAVKARERATLAARIPASVVELPHREGDRVAAGTVLVRLDDAALRSALAAAEAQAQAAEAELRRAESLRAKGAATERELEDAQARAATARAGVSGAKDNLAYAVLRAPFSGRVVSRAAALGDVVAPGRTLIEIESDAGLELVASVEADAVTALRAGMSLQARVDGIGEPLPAVVRVVSPSGDPATHRFEVKADLPAATGLRAGLFARIALPLAGAEARLLVPSRALVRRGGLVGVFVVADGRARLRWIAIGEAEGDATEARAGVAAGERVVLDPGGLADGTPLRESR